jgi:hypothetical protein
MSIPTLNITGFPMDTDHNRWAMLHDGITYRYYAFKEGSVTEFYQGGFNPGSQDYEYGYLSIQILTVEMMPADSDTGSHAMLHDNGVAGTARYRFYYQTQIP